MRYFEKKNALGRELVAIRRLTKMIEITKEKFDSNHTKTSETLNYVYPNEENDTIKQMLKDGFKEIFKVWK